MSGGATGLTGGQEAGLGTSAATMGAGAALAPATGGASLLPGAIMMGGSLLGDIMGNSDAQAQQAAQAQAALNNQVGSTQQQLLGQMGQANPYSAQLMQSGNQYSQIPGGAGALSQFGK